MLGEEWGAGDGNVKGGSIVIGIMMVALGIALTAVSYASAKPGGAYFVFIGLMIGGFITFIRGAMAPDGGSASSGSRGNGYGSRARPARTLPEDYVAPPEMMPAGYCWACGRKVRKGNIICLACGAAQVLAPQPARSDTQEPEEPYGYGSSYSGGSYPDGSYPSGPYPDGSYPGGSYPRSSYRGGQYPGGPNAGGPYPGGPNAGNSPQGGRVRRGRYPDRSRR
jgi:hypothetical protein